MSGPSEFEVASCTGKVRFASYDAAGRIQKRRGRDRQYRQSEVYRCRICQGWHLGRAAQAERPKHEWRRYQRAYEEQPAE